jgi:transcriptional regulator with XRE-family HTH domain
MQIPHPLQSWIDQRMSQAEFARRAGMSQTHLTHMLQFKRGISLDLACRIEEITEGEFTAKRLRDLQDRNLSREAAGAQ